MNKFKAIKTEIKEKSEQQKVLKSYRKREDLTWEDLNKLGIETPKDVLEKSKWYLQYPHWYKPKNNLGISWRKKELMHLFQAYAILKGKERPKITKSGKELDEKEVQDLVEKFKNNLDT